MPATKPAARRSRIRFCPKCGSVMYPRIKDGKKQLFCPRCGYTIDIEDEALEAYKVKRKVEHSPKDKIIVVEADQVPSTAVLLKGQVRCPKCGHDEVYFWMMQTRAADEPPTRFYRCKRCGYTWREYA